MWNTPTSLSFGTSARGRTGCTSVADEPCSRLFGRAPAGLNATGESETRDWYDSVRAEAQKKAAPNIKRVYRLAGLSRKSPMAGKKVDWLVTFKPLWSPTDLQVAQTEQARATRDQIYIEAGVVSPEEVALSPRDVYPQLDFAAREAAVKASVSHDPHENDEADPYAQQGEPLGQGAPIPTLGPNESPEGGGAKVGALPRASKVPPKTVPTEKADAGAAKGRASEEAFSATFRR
jgi:hypothetical protein